MLPSPTAILADGKRAFDYWAQQDPQANCGWTGSTFLIGVMEYYKASASISAADPAALAYATGWAKAYDYNICGGVRVLEKEPQQPSASPKQ